MKPQPTEYSSVFWHGIITPLLPEPIPFICDSTVNVDLETQQMDAGRNATQIENDVVCQIEFDKLPKLDEYSWNHILK